MNEYGKNIMEWKIVFNALTIRPTLTVIITLLFAPLAALHAADARPVYVVPNFHPASCGWLTDWSTERNYCANSYFDYLDRVRDDANYHFALSECNNLIAMLDFRPDRAAELQQRIREGRVELCNAFFVEPTIHLSGGEALAKMGVEGLRWQQQMMGVRPRLSWMIDVTGMHEQMAQIVTGLGLGAPVLILGGSGDYNLAPLCKSHPSEFLQPFRKVAPEFDVKFTTPSRYLDAVLPGIHSGAIQLPVLRGGTEFTYNAFWIQNPRVKMSYRRCEQWLQAAEMLATAASLRGKFEYPAQDLYRAWLLMCLNMDRNTLWGAAGGMVFEHERSWEVQDRFEWVERASRDIAARAPAGGQ